MEKNRWAFWASFVVTWQPCLPFSFPCTENDRTRNQQHPRENEREGELVEIFREEDMKFQREIQRGDHRRAGRE